MNKVIHYKAGPYLPITENWIYEIISNHHKYTPIIYCQGILNLVSFPANTIRSLNFNGLNNPGMFLNELWNKFFNFYPYYLISMIKDKPQIIHAHFGLSGYSILKTARLLNIPLITTFYGQDLSMLPQQYPIWKERYKVLFQKGKCFLVEGSYMKNSLTALGCPKNKIIVQHIGINLENIPFIARMIKPNEEVKILISASFREKKGIPVAIEALGVLKNKYPSIKFSVDIIGDSTGDYEGETEKTKILEAIRKYKLTKNINFLGFQPHLTHINELYKHHIFLSPSITASTGDTEGGAPVSIIEASASGMPVVSTFHCDIPEIIIDNKSGYLVEERNSAKLAEKLSELIYNTDSWVKMAKAGRDHIEKNYNIKKQIIKLEKIYNNLMG